MKPKPVVVTTVCSECGLDWDLHGENPTTSDCIRLLKAELAKRPVFSSYVGGGGAGGIVQMTPILPASSRSEKSA